MNRCTNGPWAIICQGDWHTSLYVFSPTGKSANSELILVNELDWPLCTAARHFTTAILDPNNASPTFPYSRVFEGFRADDGPALTAASDQLCNYSELTDIGRRQMLNLGKSLRNLYMGHLQLLPPVLTDPHIVTFRGSPIERAQVSLHHVIYGLLPPEARATSFGTPKIVMRSAQDETLLPNEDFCNRFIQICKDYTRRTSQRWDQSPDMEHLNARLRKYMPDRTKLAVKSKPSIHNLHDIITATEATERPDITLPEEFYEPKVRQIVERIAYEEEYAAFHESQEMRQVGIGALLGDVVERMVTKAQNPNTLQSGPKLFLAGGHDSTLAGIMASLGAVDGITTGKWPPYASVVAVELFKDRDSQAVKSAIAKPILRTQSKDLSPEQHQSLEGYYVRVKYNDTSLVVPGCGRPGKHWEGDASFCTLVSLDQNQFEPCAKLIPAGCIQRNC